MGNWVKKRRIDLNPSSADRWTTCTASPKYIFDNWDRLPPDNRTYSDDGTTAHEVASALLQGRKVNPKDCPVPVTPEMNWNGWNYMEYVENLLEPGGRIMVEQKLPLFYAEGRNAIIDAAVINPNSLHIVDYKYGEGVIVSPVENKQETIYAACEANALDFFPSHVADDFPIFAHIYQPRTREDEIAHTWETTWGNIQRRSFDIADIAQTISANAQGGPYTVEFAPSDKACQFCPAKGFCEARPALYLQDLEVITDTPDSLPDTITAKQLEAIVRHGDNLIKWIKDRQAYALQYMRAGNSVPGFKLVTSRGGNRHWTNDKRAAKYLLEDTILREEEIFTEPQLIGPAAIEKLIGKKKFSARVYGLIGKAPGQSIIAPEDDPRPNALVDATQEFVDLDAPKGVDLDAGKDNLDQF